jgi:hypothetical protein
MTAPWKIAAQRPAKRRADKARTRLAEELFIEAARRLIEKHEWYEDRPHRSRRRTAEILAEGPLAARGITLPKRR